MTPEVSDGNGGKVSLRSYIEAVMEREVARLETCIDANAKLSDKQDVVNLMRFERVEENATHRQQVLERLDLEITRRFEDAEKQLFRELAVRDLALHKVEKSQAGEFGRWTALSVAFAAFAVGSSILFYLHA